MRGPVWLHHGSSISAGSNAASPSTTWPALAARAHGVELTNLGFSGSAMVDPFTARAMRDTPADLISVKLGINVVNADVMRRRAFGPAVHGFLDTVRDGHPATPLLLVSPVLCPIHEDTPGPGAVDMDSLGAGTLRFRATGDPAEVAAGKLTLTAVREELRRVAARRRTSGWARASPRSRSGPAVRSPAESPGRMEGWSAWSRTRWSSRAWSACAPARA